MTRILRTLGAVLILAILCGAQNSPITTTQLNLPVSINLTPVSSAAVSIVGNPGPQTYYYWFVPNYLLGQGPMSGPFIASNAPNALSGSNYVQVVPTYPPGAVLDMLRTNSPTPPIGTCNCAVATGHSSGVFNDLSISLSSYTVFPVVLQNLGLTLANEPVGSGATDLILRQFGRFVADLSVVGSGTITGPGSSITGDIAIWNNLAGTALADSFVSFPLANASLQHPSLTLNSTTLTLGGSFTITAAPSGGATGDLGGSYPAPTVQGVNAVPLCTGFTPTNLQALVYSTASSPNPCWAAINNTSTVAAQQFAFAYYSGSGIASTINGVAGATSPNGVPYVFASIPAGGVATTPVLALPGIVGRSVTGASDTIVSTDCNPKRIAYTGAAAVAVALPTPATLGVGNCSFKIANNTSNTVTVTPATWTISAGSGGTPGASLAIAQGQEAILFVDPVTATNWVADVVEQAILAGTNITLTRSPSGVTINDSFSIPSSVVQNNQVNTFTSVGALDLHLAIGTNNNQMRVPVLGSGGVSMVGAIAVDSANLHFSGSGGDNWALWMAGGASFSGSVPIIAGNLSGLISNSEISNVLGSGGVKIGSPTGGQMGSGTLNTAASIFVNGVAVLTSVGNIPLSSVINPTGAIAEIQDGDNPLFISSAATTSGRVAVEFGEHTASTAAGTPYELQALTLIGSNATPFNITNSLNGSQTLPSQSITPTWNTTGIAQGLNFNVTCTAALTGSMPFVVRLAGTEQTSLKYGAANCASPEWIIPNGTAPLPGLAFEGSVTSGLYQAAVNVMGVSSNGTGDFAFTGGGQVSSTGKFCFASTGTLTAACDTSLSRSAAAVLAVGSGAQGDTSGQVKAAAYMSIGAKFTSNAGCSETTLVGGATAGKFTAVSTSCTVIITFGNTATAPNGWACNAHDITTLADYNNPRTSSTATTLTIVSGTIVSGDVIEFTCTGY